jgi:mutator protein MutT
MIHVVAGAVVRADGQVLIAQRPPGKHLAGGWEFPGGKLEPGEGRAAGLERELGEELGIVIRDPRPLMRVNHTYPYGEVCIDMWVVTRYSGEPKGLDGQALRWCHREELESADLLPADRPIVRALRLPAILTPATVLSFDLDDGGDDAGDLGQPQIPDKLRGARCATPAAARAAAPHRDFIVLSCELSDLQLGSLCAALCIPIFVRSRSLEKAWALGASGISELDPSR